MTRQSWEATVIGGLLHSLSGKLASRPFCLHTIQSQLMTNCRFPVMLAGTDTEIRTGEEASVEAEAPPLLKFTIVSQPGLPRRQMYYPYMSFRLSRPLQVKSHLHIAYRMDRLSIRTAACSRTGCSESILPPVRTRRPDHYLILCADIAVRDFVVAGI